MLRTLMHVVLLGSTFAGAAGCNEAPLTKPHFVNDVAAGKLCLSQVTSNRIEIVRVDAKPIGSLRRIVRKRTVVGPNGPVSIEDRLPLSLGQVAPDGSFVAATDGSHLVGLTLASEELWSVKTDVRALSISSDSKKIVVSSGRSLLATYDVRTQQLHSLNVFGKNPSWAPGADRIAYDDGKNTHIHDLLYRRSVDIGGGTEPSWSADGGSVAVRTTSERVELVNLASRERTVLVDRKKYVSTPRWSPGGEWMTYSYRGARQWWSKSEWEGAETHQIILRDTKTGSEASIGQFYKANPGNYQWIASAELCASSP